MVDVSRVQTRTTDQNRITNNRDGIIPNRRDTNAPDRKIFADLRGTLPGDNGAADQLRKALGMVGNAAEGFQAYANAKHDKREEELGSQGAIDAAVGMADPELVRTSMAYRASSTTYDAQTAFFKSSEELDDKLKQVIFEQQDAAPEVRIAEINRTINDHYKALLVDEETGKVRDFGSPQAAKWLAQQVGSSRAEVQSKAFQMVEDRMAEDSITKAADAFGASLRAGKPIGFEDVMSNLLPTVDRKKAKEALITVSQNTAQDLYAEGEELLETDPEAAQVKFTQALHIVDNLRGSRVPGDTGIVDPKADPLAPLPDAPKAPAAPAGKLIVPFHGFEAKPSSGMGAARSGGSSHNGEDFPAPKGTVVKAPMGGEVIASFKNQRGGNQVRVRLDNGAIVGFAHLSTRDVKVGDKVGAGQQLALSGNTGRSTGPHVHMTVEVGGKKVSPSEFFKSGGAVATADAAGAVPEAVIDPENASAIASHAANTSGLRAPAGAYSLTPSERGQLSEFRRRMVGLVNEATEKAREKRQSTTAVQFALGLAGVGPSTTPTEVANAARRGDISPSHAVSLINTYESEVREARAEVRAERSAENEVKTENKVATVDAQSNAILGDLYSGKLNATSAQQKLLKILPTITDRETRQAVLREVTQGISAHVELRNASPEYRMAMGQFDEWEGIYRNGVKRSVIGRDDRGREDLIIKQFVDAFRVKLARDAVLDPSRVPAFMEQAEKRLDNLIARRFPARTVKNSSSVNAYGGGQ